MGMSRHERRELRRMAEAIRGADPVLASMLGADTWNGARTAGRSGAARNGLAADGTANTEDGGRWSPWSPGAWAPGSGRYTPFGLF